MKQNLPEFPDVPVDLEKDMLPSVPAEEPYREDPQKQKAKSKPVPLPA